MFLGMGIVQFDVFVDDVGIDFRDEDFFNIATDSNASLDGSLIEPSDYETAVMNRLDMMTVSIIISTCILFLLLLCFRKG